MKNKWIVVPLLMAGFNLSLLTKDLLSEPRSGHYFFNFSIAYPLSINKSKQDSTNINLSLFYGHVGQIQGLDVSGLVSAVEGNINGLQIAGLAGVCGDEFTGVQIVGGFSVAGKRFSGIQLCGGISVSGETFHGWQTSGLISVVGNSFRGVQVTGGLNVVGEDAVGLQASGLFNVTGERFRGIQATGAFNVTGEDYVGLQAAAGFNVTGDDHDGLQAAGGFNVTGDDYNGLQVAGGFNVVGDVLSGLQLGTFNIAATSRGAQIGVVNTAGKLDGFQLGLINYSIEGDGIPVGLINISKYDGRIKWINWASNLSGMNSGVKFTVNNIYSIITLGGINFYGDITESLVYAGFYGVSFPFGRLSLNTDIGYMYLDNEDIFRKRMGKRDQHVALLRASLNMELSKRFSLFAGSGLGYISDYNTFLSSGEVYTLFFAGLELF
ncbi:MAG: hypothetical protein KAU46_10605 [Candidatus Aminicenantes bacterium]|nr:hypothetical protein [Candidatus Aminicenantes bacterium]